MLERFDLFLVLRQQLRDRALLRSYLAVEAVMCVIARRVELDVDVAALVGLGLGCDAATAATNPESRGAHAEALLRSEGASPEVIAAVVDARRRPVSELAPMAVAAVCAEYAGRAVFDAAHADGIDAVDERTLAFKAERRALSDDESDAARAIKAAGRLGLSVEQMFQLAIDTARENRADLRL